MNYVPLKFAIGIETKNIIIRALDGTIIDQT